MTASRARRRSLSLVFPPGGLSRLISERAYQSPESFVTCSSDRGLEDKVGLAALACVMTAKFRRLDEY